MKRKDLMVAVCHSLSLSLSNSTNFTIPLNFLVLYVISYVLLRVQFEYIQASQKYIVWKIIHTFILLIGSACVTSLTVSFTALIDLLQESQLLYLVAIVMPA